MFILARLSDTVKLLPSTEYSPAAITQWLNAKYSNRVLHKVGLCIAVYDILSVGDGALKYGDGCVYIKSLDQIKRRANNSRVSDECLSAFYRGGFDRENNGCDTSRDSHFVGIFR